MKSDDFIKKEFRKRPLRETFYEELDNFLNARKNYLDGTDERAEMLFWYDIIYTSMKAMWNNGVINDADFWYLTEIAGEE